MSPGKGAYGEHTQLEGPLVFANTFLLVGATPVSHSAASPVLIVRAFPRCSLELFFLSLVELVPLSTKATLPYAAVQG